MTYEQATLDRWTIDRYERILREAIAVRWLLDHHGVADGDLPEVLELAGRIKPRDAHVRVKPLTTQRFEDVV